MIYLFRHGETLYNLGNKFQGRIDLPLCNQGIARFERIGKNLPATNIKAIYSSDLKRAIQSAEIIAKKIKHPTLRSKIIS